LKLGPLRAFRCPPACRRVRRRSTPSGFRTPPTVSPGLAPCEAGCHPRLGSALGFSQPLSGFLATPSSAALFRAATVPGILPSELSPRRDRLPLSGQLGFPAVIHQRAETHASTPYRPWFHRRPRPARPHGFPNDYELPFPEPKPVSWSLWVSSHGTVPFRQLHLLRSVSPSSSPFAAKVSLPTRTGRCSLGFRPL
jgi:hypothetical protein